MAGRHRRNLAGLRAAPRCGARTRAGTPCRAPALAGKARCRMHGGRGSGAPRGNRNARKHGRYSAAEIVLRRALAALLREARAKLGGGG